MNLCKIQVKLKLINIILFMKIKILILAIPPSYLIKIPIAELKYHLKLLYLQKAQKMGLRF